MGVAGTRVLVTGGLSGIGAAIARAYAARGARVLVTDVAHVTDVTDVADVAHETDETDVADVADVADGAGPEALTRAANTTSYLRLDVRSDADWARARDWVVDAWGGLDILVNNAGIGAAGRVGVMATSEWERVIEINLQSTSVTPGPAPLF